MFGSVAGGGGAVGLILGGVLTEYLNWRWTLYVNLIFAAIAVAGALVYMHTPRPADRPRMDWVGTLLACTGLFGIVFGFSHAETAGWSAALTLGSLAAGLALLAGFAAAEQRVRHPLLPLPVILDRARGGAYVAVGVAGIAIFGVFLFLTYYLQTIKGYSPVGTGLAFLPLIACILAASNTSSIVLPPRLGPRTLIATGMLLGGGAIAPSASQHSYGSTARAAGGTLAPVAISTPLPGAKTPPDIRPGQHSADDPPRTVTAHRVAVHRRRVEPRRGQQRAHWPRHDPAPRGARRDPLNAERATGAPCH